jgi:hypothetical protein
MGTNFWTRLKNLLTSLHCKAHVKARPSYGNDVSHRSDTHMGLQAPCVRVEEGFNVFLGLCENVFFYFAIPWMRSYSAGRVLILQHFTVHLDQVIIC